MHETHTGYKEDGSVSYSYEVEYDSNGKALKQTDFSSDGTVDSISEFDENENIIKVPDMKMKRLRTGPYMNTIQKEKR